MYKGLINSLIQKSVHLCAREIMASKAFVVIISFLGITLWCNSHFISKFAIEKPTIKVKITKVKNRLKEVTNAFQFIKWADFCHIFTNFESA